MKLAEWNETLKYAKEKASALDESIIVSSYKMYEGKMGISFRVFDCFGTLFKEFYTGINKTKEEFISAIDRQIERIKTEVL